MKKKTSYDLERTPSLEANRYDLERSPEKIVNVTRFSDWKDYIGYEPILAPKSYYQIFGKSLE